MNINYIKWIIIMEVEYVTLNTLLSLNTKPHIYVISVFKGCFSCQVHYYSNIFNFSET